MKQDNQLDHTAHSWQVIDKIATIVNPIKLRPTDYYIDVAEMLAHQKEYGEHEKFAATHQFATNAEPGTYEGKEFKMITQQQMPNIPNPKWVTCTKMDGNWQVIKDWRTRQFLEYIGEPKGEESYPKNPSCEPEECPCNPCDKCIHRSKWFEFWKKYESINPLQRDWLIGFAMDNKIKAPNDTVDIKEAALKYYETTYPNGSVKHYDGFYDAVLFFANLKQNNLINP